MLRLSYWVCTFILSLISQTHTAQVFPIISGFMWLGTLLGLLIFWCVDEHRAHYASMDPRQTIAYISDVGATRLKPLFITGCVITTIFLDISFLSDRWLRHRGRLVPETTKGQKVLSALTIFWALVGTAGLILLSIFDTLRHPKLHDIFLLLFMGGYVLSAIFICWEYQRLGRRTFPPSFPRCQPSTANHISSKQVTVNTGSSRFPSTSSSPSSSSRSSWPSPSL